MDWFHQILDLLSGKAAFSSPEVMLKPTWVQQFEGFLKDFFNIDVPNMTADLTGTVSADEMVDMLSMQVNSLLDAVVKEYNQTMTELGEVDKKILSAQDLLEKTTKEREFIAQMATTFPFYHALRRANIKFLQEMDDKGRPDTKSLETRRIELNQKAEGYAAKRDQLDTLSSDVMTLQNASGYTKGSQEWRDQYNKMYDKYYGLLYPNWKDTQHTETVADKKHLTQEYK